jgi:hypothetical protein
MNFLLYELLTDNLEMATQLISRNVRQDEFIPIYMSGACLCVS